MSTPRTLVALATYNEIENLPGLSPEILRVLPTADLLVVDDNSPDGSGRWCDEFAATEPRVHGLHRPGKLGLGSATLDAFRWALAREYDVVVTMDADWSHDPSYLPTLVAAMGEADVAIGSRYVSGGSIVGWPLHRRAMSRLINGISRTLLGLRIHDASGAFRAYRASALRRIPLDEIRATGYAYLEEIAWHLARADALFVEIPIAFHERRAGQSKINLQEATGKVATILRLVRASAPRTNPTKD